MIRKYVLFIVLILLGFSTCVFFLRRYSFTTDGPKQVRLLPNDKVVNLQLHPLASEEKITEAKKQLVSTWEEWLDARTEILIAQHIVGGFYNTSDEIEAWRQKIRNPEELFSSAYLAERFKAVGISPPKYPIHPPENAFRKLWELEKRYQGSQTPEALIAEFDQKFLDSYPESIEWEEIFPKNDFLQRILDKGVRFENHTDYVHYLRLRRELIEIKNKPSEWISGSRGIPITTNFEEYVDGFIDRKIWENNIIKNVAQENSEYFTTTVFFPRNYPDKYLPVAGNVTYVRQRPSGAMSTFGAKLTEEQLDNLLYKSIEPENIEIVFIDDNYNILSEKPKPFDPVKWREENSYDNVPEGLRSPDGIIVSPERYEEILGKPMSTEIRQRYDEYVGTESPVDSDAVRREAAREAAASAQKAAKTEFEKFQNSILQPEEFATMSDAEIEKALERQFRRQFLPEHPVEQLTPERLEGALGTLYKHGFDEGFRRVKRDSPALAKQLERYFGTGRRVLQKSKPPQRSAPPKPPEAPPETDAP